MKVQYFSDLHINYYNPETFDHIKIDCDVLIIAGDIGNPTLPHYKAFLQYISEHVPKTFIVAGNHEYYNHKMTIEQTNEYIQNMVSNWENISFLNNTYEDYNGYRFCGSVLWCTPSCNDYLMNPQRHIHGATFIEINNEYQKCYTYLKQQIQLSKEQQMPLIIITHYLPSYELIDAQYRTEQFKPLLEWFASNSDDLIDPFVQAWFYGHTHKQKHCVINSVNMYCNPLGYPNENVHNYECYAML